MLLGVASRHRPTLATLMRNEDFDPQDLLDRWAQLRPLIPEMTPQEAEASGLLRSLLHTFDPLDEERRTPMMLAYWQGNLETAHVMGRLGENYELEDAQGRDGHWYLEHAGEGVQAARMSHLIELQRQVLAMHNTINRQVDLARQQGRQQGAAPQSDSSPADPDDSKS